MTADMLRVVLAECCFGGVLSNGREVSAEHPSGATLLAEARPDEPGWWRVRALRNDGRGMRMNTDSPRILIDMLTHLYGAAALESEIQ